MKSNFSNSNEFCTLFDFQSDEDMFAGMPPMAGLPNMPDPSEMSGGSEYDSGSKIRTIFEKCRKSLIIQHCGLSELNLIRKA